MIAKRQDKQDSKLNFLMLMFFLLFIFNRYLFILHVSLFINNYEETMRINLMNSVHVNQTVSSSQTQVKPGKCLENLKILCIKVLNGLKVLAMSIRDAFHFSNYKIIKLDLKNLSPEWQRKLKEFESGFTYPFDSQRQFRIIHGKGDQDYFGFMKRMGETKFYVVINKRDRIRSKKIKSVNANGVIQVVTEKISCKKGEIAAVGCGILRTFERMNKKPLKAWYLCDFKVGNKYRNQHLMTSIFKHTFWRFFQAPRGYAICMNPGGGEKPPAAKIWDKHTSLSSQKVTLNLYNLNYEQITTHRREIENALGEVITFKSMQGIKEFEIFSKTNPNDKTNWNLLHIQHGSKGEKTISSSNFENPQPGHDHMFATVDGCQLDQALKNIQLQFGPLTPSSTATLIAMGMDRSLFERGVVTNEI